MNVVSRLIGFIAGSVEGAGYTLALMARALFHVGSLARGHRLDALTRQMFICGVTTIPVTLVVSVFTGAILALNGGLTLEQFGQETLMGRIVAVSMTREVIALADAAGSKLEADAEALVAASAERMSLPTSTLQDVRAGRSLELDAILNVLLEIGQLTGVATPNLAVIAACANLLNQRITVDGVAIRPIQSK